jgi:hypothetical protein
VLSLVIFDLTQGVESQQAVCGFREEGIMSLDRQEILEELAHKKELIQALVRRRRPLELQAAHRGLSTPPEVLTEISSLTDQLRRYEDEVTHLETLAAQGALPLPEVEYRVLLAETWDTPRGQRTVAGAVRLELARLRLGIVPERAHELEREIRVALAQESFNNIEPSAFVLLCAMDKVQTNPEGQLLNAALVHLGRAIRLDPETAQHLLFINLPSNNRTTLDTQILRDRLLSTNKVHQHSEDFLLFNHFLIALTADIESQTRKDKRAS